MSKSVSLLISMMLCCVFSIPAALASPFHSRLGIFAWRQSPSGYIRYSSGGNTQASNVDLRRDAGLGNGTGPYIRATFTHTLPLLPDLSLSYTGFDRSGSATLDRSITYGDHTYAANTTIHSRVQLNELAAALFYRPVRKPFTLRLGLMGDHIAAEGTLSDSSTTTSATSSAVVPAIYGGVEIPLPPGLRLSAQGGWIGYGGMHFDRWQAEVGWTSSIGLGIAAGYRRESLKGSDRFNPSGDFSFGGVFAGLTYQL